MTWLNMMRAMFLCAGLSLPFVLSGCNATEGFGKDLQSAGEAIEEEAEDAD